MMLFTERNQPRRYFVTKSSSPVVSEINQFDYITFRGTRYGKVMYIRSAAVAIRMQYSKL